MATCGTTTRAVGNEIHIIGSRMRPTGRTGPHPVRPSYRRAPATGADRRCSADTEYAAQRSLRPPRTQNKPAHDAGCTRSFWDRLRSGAWSDVGGRCTTAAEPLLRSRPPDDEHRRNRRAGEQQHTQADRQQRYAGTVVIPIRSRHDR